MVAKKDVTLTLIAYQATEAEQIRSLCEINFP